jgi:hypothetical protein
LGLEADENLIRALHSASRGLRVGGGSTLPLREVIDRIAFRFLRDRAALILDITALRAAGLTAETSVPLAGDDTRPPWEEVGLVAVLNRDIVLLTSQGQLAAWEHSGGDGGLTALFPMVKAWETAGTLPEAIQRAITTATQQGQDPSGRFRTALHWLRPEAEAGRPHGPSEDSGVDLPAWTEWEMIAEADGAHLVVVNRTAAAAAGLVLTAFLFLFGWKLRFLSGGLQATLLLAGLALAGLSLLWLPGTLHDLAWWPLVAGCVLGLIWYFRAARASFGERRKAPSTARAIAAGAGATVVLLACGDFTRTAPTPVNALRHPSVVYLLPGPAGEDDPQSVLVPAELLDRLKSLGKPYTPDGAVLIRATYEGKVEDTAAEFGAVFVAQCLEDGAAVLALPLEGVQLVGDVWVDGARGHPVTSPAPQAGYALTLKGRGRHKVELRFRVPLTRSSAEHGVQFSIPPLLQSRLVFRTPPGAAAARLLLAHGAWEESADAGGRKLEADLGRLTTPLGIRWIPEGVPAVAKVQYRAAYLWDLRADASTLKALIHCRAPRGSTGLAVVVPPELEVRAAEAHRAATNGSVPVRLHDWHVDRNAQPNVLRLDLAAPAGGEFDVVLELVPRSPLPSVVTLPLPTPLADALPGDHYLAYRTQGLEARRVQVLNVTGIKTTDFAHFWPLSSRPDPRNLAYACTVRRDPVLRLELRPQSSTLDAAQEIDVRVGPTRAQVNATLTLAAPARDLAFIEWEVHSARPLNAVRISGPDVRHWSQDGPRLRVWLERSVRSTQLELGGWLPLSADGKGGEKRLEVPCFRVPEAAIQRTTVRLEAAGELVLSPEGSRNLALAARPDCDMTYETRERDYALSCQVRPAGEGAAARVLTIVETRGGRLAFTAFVDFHPGHDDLRWAQVFLRHWAGEDVRLEAPSVARRRERRTQEGRSWVLGLQPGVKGPYRLTLSGEVPLEDMAAGAVLPEISVPGVAKMESWLAVVGGELAAEVRGALQAVDAAELADWPRERDRLRGAAVRVWQVTGTEWQVRLLPSGTGAAPPRVFLAEHSAAVVGPGRWLHEVVWWLRHEAHTDLAVRLPAPARVVAVGVDGVQMTPLQPESNSLWLPLPGRAGVRRVRLRWLYETPESLDHPNLEQPRLEGTVEGPTLWTAWVPRGWEATRESALEGDGSARLGRGAGREAALDLYRAEAQLAITREVGGGREADLVQAQRRLLQYLGHAERALTVGAGRDGVHGPGGQSLVDWLAALRKANMELGRAARWNELLEEAERGTSEVPPPGFEEDIESAPLASREDAMSMPERGTPVSWHSGPDGAAPQLRLVPAEVGRANEARMATGRLLGLLGVAWLAALIPFVGRFLQRFWPEEMVLLGCWGWYQVGPTYVVLFLILLGGCWRLALLLQGTRRLFRRPRKAPSTAVPAGNLGS